MPRRIRPRSQNPPEASLEFVRLGKLGVNVVDSPLHLSDGELRKAQNAEPFDVRGEEALRKRKGIDLFTSASLGGPVLAMTSVPLPDPFPPFAGIAYLGGGSGPAAHYSDASVSSWADTTSPDPDASGARMCEGRGFQNGTILYYIASAGSGGTVKQWSGPGQASSTFGTEPTGGSITINARQYNLVDAGRVPTNGLCGDADNGILFFLVEYQAHDDTPTAWILYKWRIGVDSAFAQLGEGFYTESVPATGYIAGRYLTVYGQPVFWQGRVWLAVNVSGGGSPQIYSIAAGESNWTLDATLSGTDAVGVLYTDASANFLWLTRQSTPQTLQRRDTLGVYSTKYTSTAGSLTAAYATDDTIYVIENQFPSVGWIVKRSTDGGGTWATVYTDSVRGPGLGPDKFRAVVAFEGGVYLINMYGETVRLSGTAGLLDTWASDLGGQGVLLG